MNAINVTAVTPMFMSLLFGTALVVTVIGVLAIMNWSTAGSAYMLAGALLYLAGVIVVTIVFNVPLNDQLAATAPDSPAAALTRAGTYFPSRSIRAKPSVARPSTARTPTTPMIASGRPATRAP